MEIFVIRLALVQSPWSKEFLTRTLTATDKPKGIYKQDHFTISKKKPTVLNAILLDITTR